LTVKTTTGKHKCLVPEEWHEVTLEQIIKLDFEFNSNISTTFNILSVFTDLPVHEIENTSSNLWKPLLSVMDFIYKPPNWKKLKKPDTIHFLDKEITLPKDISLATFGQKVFALQAMNKKEPDAMADVITTYIQPCYDGYVSTERIEELRNHVLQLPAIQAVPIGRFFLTKLIRRKKYGLIGLTLSRRMQLIRLHLKQQAAQYLTRNSKTS
jgi:hypothetical protein